jgi:hypothetical protein
MTEEQEKAARGYEDARKEVEKALPTNNGGKRAEVRYADAYQRLVQVGLAPQLKRKYRPTAGV